MTNMQVLSIAFFPLPSLSITNVITEDKCRKMTSQESCNEGSQHCAVSG